MSTTAATIQPAVMATPSPWQEFWHQFKQNRGALFGLAIILFFIVVAILAPMLAPHSPSELDATALRLPPRGLAGSADTYLLGPIS